MPGMYKIAEMVTAGRTVPGEWTDAFRRSQLVGLSRTGRVLRSPGPAPVARSLSGARRRRGPDCGTTRRGRAVSATTLATDTPSHAEALCVLQGSLALTG